MARKRAAPLPPWFDDPQYRAFEADIVEHPDDDTPRLVLADWLDDHGDEHTAARAEFLRVQVELARLGSEDPRRPALERRQAELLKKHEAYWLGPLQGVAKGGEWRRGFLDRLRLGVRQFMDHADLLFRLAPMLHLQLLRISHTTMTMDELAACPYFARLRGLTLTGSAIGDDKLANFLGGANLENLEALELAGAGVGHRTFDVLARGGTPRLRRLDLSGNVMGSVFESFCSEKPPFKLREFRIAAASLGPVARAALLGWSGLAEVEKLDLGWNRLGTDGGAELAACPYLGNLRELDLTFCEIGARGIQAIADAGAFPGLCELNLNNNQIRPTGMEAFLRCSFLNQLGALRLENNLLGDTGIERLAAWPGLARHTRLELRSNAISPKGVEALCASPYLGEPTTLSLSMNSIGDRGAVALAGCPRLAKLTRLELVLCEVGDAGADALLASPHLKNLELLKFFGNSITTPCVRRVNERFRHATRNQ